MAKTRALVKRRKAVRNIRKITRTMELIATARFKKAMDRSMKAEAFTRKIAALVADLSRSAAAAQHPLLEPRPEIRNALFLALTSNRGLCGGYNNNVIRIGAVAYRELRKSMKADGKIDLEVSGKRGINSLRYQGLQIDKTFTHFEEKPTFDEVEVLADRYIELFVSGKIDRLDIAYTKFISRGKQVAVVETLLPMSSMGDQAAVKADEKKAAEVTYEFMPSSTDILNEIVPTSFKTRLFKCFLDAAVSEQISRMVAMKGATENAGGLIKALTRKYNRARQSQITSEIAEIIGTVEALKQALERQQQNDINPSQPVTAK